MDYYEELQRPLLDLNWNPNNSGILSHNFVDKVRRGYQTVPDVVREVVRHAQNSWSYGNGDSWGDFIIAVYKDHPEEMESMARWAIEWEKLSLEEKAEIKAKRRSYGGRPREKIDGWGAVRSFLPEERR